MNELRIIARCALMLAGALACAGASAQASAASSPGPDATSAADRAQKQADRTLYWIRVLAEKPATKPAVAAPAKPAATAAAAPPPAARAAAAASDSRQAANIKVASAGAPSSAVASDSGGSSGVVTPVGAAAAAPAIPLPAGVAGNAMAAGGVAAGLGAPAVAASLAAPTLTPPPTDVAPPEADEPDPGLIMTKSADPQFPMATMRRLRKGEVEVKFEVGSDGQVEVVSVVHSTNPGLNNAALDAVRQWQFKPTPKGHTAVVDLAFDLDA